DFYIYNESLQQVKLYVPPITLNLPGRIYTVIVDPVEIGVLPDGFVETALSIGGKTVPAWKLADAQASSSAYGVYLLRLKDAAGLSAFYLFDEKTSDIMGFDTLQDHGLLVTAETTAPSPSPSVSPQASPSPTPIVDGAGASSPVLVVAAVILAAICVSETAYIVWTFIERRKGRPRVRRI
ncbi:MAG TPA: hypothetical protein VIL27_08815, partial [Clostridia bacterium]